WSRRVRGDGPVVDDASAARLLALHDLDGFLRAEEGARQVGVDDGLPLLEGQVLERNGWRPDAGIVEEEVETAERVLRLRKESADGFGIGDVRGHRKRGRAGGLALGRHRLQEILAAPGQDDRVAFLHESQGRVLADAGARARDDRNLAGSSHVVDALLYFLR